MDLTGFSKSYTSTSDRVHPAESIFKTAEVPLNTYSEHFFSSKADRGSFERDLVEGIA